MGSNSIPQNSFGWECKARSSLYTHAFYRTSSKNPDFHVLDEWMPATKTHPPCTIHEDGMWLPQWLNWKTVTNAKISPKMVNPRGIATNAVEKECFDEAEQNDQQGKQYWESVKPKPQKHNRTPWSRCITTPYLISKYKIQRKAFQKIKEQCLPASQIINFTPTRHSN